MRKESNISWAERPIHGVFSIDTGQEFTGPHHEKPTCKKGSFDHGLIDN